MRTARRNLAQQQSWQYRFFRDADGNVAVWDTPNVPLIVAMVSAVLQLLTTGRFSELMGLLFFGALFTWAWLEIISGASMFRRVLGGFVLVGVLWLKWQSL